MFRGDRRTWVPDFYLDLIRRNLSHRNVHRAAFRGMANRVCNEIAQGSAKHKGVTHRICGPGQSKEDAALVRERLIELKEGSLPESERRRCLAVARRQIDHLNGLVGRILELARLESPELRLEMKTLVFDELVKDVLERFSLDGTRRAARAVLSSAARNSR